MEEHTTSSIQMADVNTKPETVRRAVAQVEFHASEKVMEAIRTGTLPKGDVLIAAQLAGIQAVKRTSDLIPLCHPLRITHADVQISLSNTKAVIRSEVTATDRTGVEMEALTAAATAALTLYDMTKSLEKGMRITELVLLEKSGGRSGDWKRELT